MKSWKEVWRKINKKSKWFCPDCGFIGKFDPNVKRICPNCKTPIA